MNGIADKNSGLKSSSIRALISLVLVFLMATASVRAAESEQIFVFASERDSQGIQAAAVSTIKSRLSRSGFTVRDDVSLLSAIGIDAESTKASILRRSSALAQFVGNAVLVFVDAKAVPITAGQELRVSAELYSTASNSFLTSWSVPTNAVMIPNSCTGDCATGLLSDEIERMADTLGSSLVQLLQRPVGASDTAENLVAILEVELIDFTNDEIIQLIDLMRNEFPGFVDITRAQASGPRYRMLYHTTADLQKLGTWIDISLEEIGLRVDLDVQRVITEQRIDIRKIDAATRKGSAGNTTKYN